MGIHLDDDEWKGWRDRLLGFLITPALIYLDIVCDALGYILEGNIQRQDGQES